MTEGSANGHERSVLVLAYLGLGSNIGDRLANLDAAVAMLTADNEIRLIARSQTYRSAPWGVVDQDWFANICVSVETNLAPRELLARCQDVENRMGRIRTLRWGPRIIDVDILTYGDVRMDAPELTIPHPLIAERGFVLVPLAEIAPDLKIGERPLSELIAKVETGDLVVLD